jgi:hypothetical protein
MKSVDLRKADTETRKAMSAEIANPDSLDEMEITCKELKTYFESCEEIETISHMKSVDLRKMDTETRKAMSAEIANPDSLDEMEITCKELKTYFESCEEIETISHMKSVDLRKADTETRKAMSAEIANPDSLDEMEITCKELKTYFESCEEIETISHMKSVDLRKMETETRKAMSAEIANPDSLDEMEITCKELKTYFESCEEIETISHMKSVDLRKMEDESRKAMSAELVNLESMDEIEIICEELETYSPMFHRDVKEVESQEYVAIVYVQPKCLYYCGIVIILFAMVGILINLFKSNPDRHRQLMQKELLANENSELIVYYEIETQHQSAPAELFERIKSQSESDGRFFQT